MNVTAFDVALRFIGLRETPGLLSTPVILAMLQLDAKWATTDEVPWCSAFVNGIAWLLNLPRSRSLAARSWLHVGADVPLVEAEPKNDVVILKRGDSDAGADVIAAPGHVGFFAGQDRHGDVLVLGGNQSNRVSIVSFDVMRVLGVRRLLE